MIRPLASVCLVSCALLSLPALSYDLKDVFVNNNSSSDIVPLDRASTSIEPGFSTHWVGSNSLASAALNPTTQQQVGSLGWRLDSNLELFTPYAEISYQRLSSNESYKQVGEFSAPQNLFSREIPNQEAHWVDVTVGANIPLTDYIAAFAELSQTNRLNNSEQFMYNIGVSANF